MAKTEQRPLAVPVTLADLDEVISQEQSQLGLYIRPVGSPAYAAAQKQWDILETVRGYRRDEPRQGARRASEASEAGGRAGREER